MQEPIQGLSTIYKKKQVTGVKVEKLHDLLSYSSALSPFVIGIMECFPLAAVGATPNQARGHLPGQYSLISLHINLHPCSSFPHLWCIVTVSKY